jgi:Protein of unknown function (DUF2510)
VGLIRKTLALGTVGLVRPSSKKQRVAKAQLNELRKQTAVLQRAEAAAAQQQHEQQLAQWRAIAQARENQAAAHLAALAAPQPVMPPPAGWFPDPERAQLLRWWDGVNWTDRTAPRGS